MKILDKAIPELTLDDKSHPVRILTCYSDLLQTSLMDNSSNTLAIHSTTSNLKHKYRFTFSRGRQAVAVSRYQISQH